ncbi:MAG: pre-toxin TG domain-containing protein, partial [bacterium]
LLGARCASLAPIYYPGEIKSEGLLKIEAGEVLILASEIIGQEVLAIDSGEGGTYVSDVLGKYLAKDTVTSHGLSFSRSTAEEEVHQPAVLISKNAITLSSRGKNAIRGSVLQSKLVSLFSEKGNELLASKQALEFKQSAFGISGAGIYSQHCNVAQEVFHNTQIFADIVKIESALDNVLEGTFILGEHAVHIKAGRDNIFRGIPLKTEISGGGWGLSLEFFGSSLLRGEGFTDITHDPLGQAIRSLLESKSVPGAVYNVAFSAMEICNALQRFQESKNFMSFLGDRFGVTDLQGKFSPRISLSFSCYDFQKMIKRYISGELAGDEVFIESDGDTTLLDGQSVHGEKHVAIRVGGSLKTTGAESKQTGSMEATSASVGNKGNKSMSAIQSDSYDTEHKPAKISSQQVDIHVAQDATFENTQITGDRVKVSVGGKLTQAVKQDVHTSESFSMAVGVDTKGGAPISLMASAASHHQTRSIDAGMYAEDDLSVEADEVHLVGTDLVSHGSLNLRTNRFEYVDVIDTEESGKIECRLSLPAKGAVVSIPIALKNTQSDCETVRKATVDGATVLSTTDLGEVNHSMETRREVLDSNDDEFCLFVPVIDTKAYAKLVDGFCQKAAQIAKDNPDLFHEIPTEEAADSSQPSSASGDILAEETPPEIGAEVDTDAGSINTFIRSNIDTVAIEEQTYERHYIGRKDSLGRIVQIEILQRPTSRELASPNVTLGDGFGFIDPERIVSMRVRVSHAGDPTHRLEFTTDAINPAVWEVLEDFKYQCEALFQSAQETAQFVYQYAAEHPEQLSIAIDFIPGVANVRAGVELITGHDYITGEDVSRWAALTNFIPGRRALEKVSPCLGFAKKSKKGLTQGKKGKQLKAGTGSSERLATGKVVRKIERGRFTTVITEADGTVRRAMNVDVVNEQLK